MTVLTDQERTLIEDLASRLRLIQADAVAATPEKRREYLQEEVVRCLKSAPAGNRKQYLQAVLERFPIAGQIVKFTPRATEPALVPPPAPVTESPEETLARLLESLPQLSEERRAEVARRLFESDLVRGYRSALVLEITAESQRSLGLATGQQPRLERLVQLCVLLIEILTRLDQMGLKALRELSPRSRLLERSQDIRSAAARFVSGESESLEPQARATSALLGGLLAAVLGGGKDFGREYLQRISPAAIEDAIAGEGGTGIFGLNRKERCWEKYKELAGNYYSTSDVIDRQIKDSLGKFVEAKVLGGR